MSKTNKRLVGILLALAMVLSMLPMAVMAADTTTLYCAAPSGWGTCNVYWWGSSQSNPGWPGEAMTQGADGIWYYDVPSDASNVIFNNGSAQSADLVMPTDDKVQFNYSAKEWVAYGDEVEEVETVYYLRGTMNNWGLDHPMTNNGDGTYSVTISLVAGTYEYKAAVEDWSWVVPEGGNLTLELAEDADVTFTLNTNDYTLTNNASVAEPTYDYYVAGSEELCGVAWDPAANQMENIYDNVYQITFEVYFTGTYEYKITTGSWETPSYGYGEGNYTVNVKNPGYVTITFDADTKEVTCEIQEFAITVLKFQLNADASADDETVDLRMISYVESLDYSKVEFVISINGVEAFAPCQTVYEAINANGQSLTCEDIFHTEGYLVTYTIENIPAEFYDADINVRVRYYSNANNSLGEDMFESGGRSFVLSDVLA